MNCIADVRKDSCEIWVPSQCPNEAQKEAAQMLGIPPKAVTVHVTMVGGGFGRRLFSDYVHETVELSHAIGKPVQLLWTRTDDMRFGFFQPPSVVRISGAFDRSLQAPRLDAAIRRLRSLHVRPSQREGAGKPAPLL